ncbi:hypothetical protein J2795_003306 [Chryseobacterium bernardetii]|uniref:Uncharacterized protein n=1 Tax=Chryseobacterium bernardetii TaxID=1241978 RepID=A0ACC6IY52_9FLAO|nr:MULTISPECIES: hypothetical protein [Chryseobacterium]MDR6372036.1 hypothetical protein [Chryseobacterium vietnamense]MDR6442581.1 hypothetical protein [Chryseobacterium bernardetii]
MRKITLYIAMACLLTASCSDTMEQYNTEASHSQLMNRNLTSEDETKYAEEGEPTVLGEQLPVPYTIESMMAAYKSLLAEPKAEGNRSLTAVNIRSTHKYIKFNPTTEDELEALQQSGLILYDYPLDREVLVVGKFYHDPDVPADQSTPQYATVKNETPLPAGVSYEILQEVYLPEEDIELLGTGNMNYKFVYSLVHRAENLSGFTPWEPSDYKPWDNIGEPGQWYPNPNPNPGGGGGGAPIYGTIRIFDTRLNTLIPFEGAKVTAKRSLRTREGITNANGQYGLSGTPFPNNRNVDFKLHMDRKHFVIKDNMVRPSNVVRNNIKSNHWSHDIMPGYENMQGHMFRAAYRYFYKDIGGLQRPVRPSGNRSHIIAKNTAKDWQGINYVAFPYLKIARFQPGSTTEYNSDDYFSTTVHELAHTSHVIKMNTGLVQYSQVNSMLQESWPCAVEWFVTGIEYRERGILNYGTPNYNPANPPVFPNRFGYQFWSLNTNSDYTSLFINLVDNFNELGQSFSPQPMGTVNDQVTGYTLANIENNFLKYCYGLSSLSVQLKANRPAGVSNAQIDVLLSSY